MNIKKILPVIFASAIIAVAGNISASAEETVDYGWVTDENSKTYYYDNTGEKLTGYCEIDGENYLFAPNGALKYGWFDVQGVRKFFDLETGVQINGWVYYMNEYFYADSTLGKLSGIQEIDGNTYYFDEDGSLFDGWFEYDGSKYYSTQETGIYKGECMINDTIYLFSQTGRFQSGWQTVDGMRIFYDYETAAPAYGWIQYNGLVYYSDVDEGKFTGERYIDGYLYRFSDKGYMETGMQEFDDGIRFYYDDGTIGVGFLEYNGNTYYFDYNTLMVTGWQNIDGNTYYFNSDGVMSTGLTDIGGYKYYFDKNGVMKTGFQTISGKKYYFDYDGVMLTGWLYIDGNNYYFDKNGVMATGICTIDGNKYGFDKNGVMLTGLQKINGKTYYFDYSGIMQTGWVYDWDTYYFDKNGVMVTGWKTIDGNRYYFGSDGVMATGFTEISDKTYFFYYDGTLATNTNINGCYIDGNGVVITINDILNTVKLNPHRSFKVYNRQTSTESSWTSSISDNDVKILKKFADEHFTSDMTREEKLRTTFDYIHYNTKYAEGSDWSQIADKSWVDAIFTYNKGQCAQYNGAMAAMMAWLGYDVNVVCGYYNREGNQHFWTEVHINGKTYVMETGNYGKNGNWQFFMLEYDYAGGYIMHC